MDDEWESVLQFVANPLDNECQKDGVQPERAMQVPTPPQSHDGSPVVDDTEDGLVSVSTTFFPGAQLLASSPQSPPDIVFHSSDGVFFYVHSHILTTASDNGFRGLVSATSRVNATDQAQNSPIYLPENSAVLNIIFHTVYDMSCSHYFPSFPSLVTAVNRLPLYGISAKICIAPSTPLFVLLLSQAPLYPLELYALAASYDLYELAVNTSSHLLSFPLATLTDAMAEHIGPVYLKRLFFLHFGRADALKRVLLPPPLPHPPTAICDFTEQKKLTRAWALASAYLAWDARPDLSTTTMESALRPLAEHLTCDGCKQALRDRIKNLIVQWSVVKRTI